MAASVNPARFLITGLPRSRTAWFALACSTDRMCWHEPTAWMDGDRDLDDLWKPGTGVSDSALALRLGWVIDRYGPRTLVVERPKAEVARSMLAYVGDALPINRKALDAHLNALSNGLRFEHPLIKRVAYRDLDDIGVLRSCFAWLGVSPKGLSQLAHMQVQSALSYNVDLIKKAA